MTMSEMVIEAGWPKTSEILAEARALIADEKGWCKEALKIVNGHTSFCARGALMEVAGGTTWVNSNAPANTNVHGRDGTIQYPRHWKKCRPAEVLLNAAAQRLFPDFAKKHAVAGHLESLLVFVNNDLGHKATLEMFDAAIADARTQETEIRAP